MTLRKNPKLAAAVKKLMEFRIAASDEKGKDKRKEKGWHPGWSQAWFINL